MLEFEEQRQNGGLMALGRRFCIALLIWDEERANQSDPLSFSSVPCFIRSRDGARKAISEL